jgi:1-acyl-sn-glycerol-3-phosphate acyltransferase
MLRPLQWLVLQALLLLLGMASLGWNLIAVLLYPLLPRRVGLVLGRATIAEAYRAFWWFASLSGLLRMEARALEPLRDEGGLIIVANHPSLLDALMLVARLPRSFCIMKASLLGNPFLAGGARLARYVRNDTGHGMIPEGTRTTQPPINPFRPGVTMIAKLAGAPIQTVFIDTDSPYLGKGWPLWRLPPIPIVFTARLGERFAPSDDSAALLRELEQCFVAGMQPRRPS